MNGVNGMDKGSASAESIETYQFNLSIIIMEYSQVNIQ